MPSPFLPALLLGSLIAAPLPAIPPTPAVSTAPTSLPTPSVAPAAPAATPGLPAPQRTAPSRAATPRVIRLGTQAVLTIRTPENNLDTRERAQVVQSRIDQVVLDHPYLTATDVKVLREGPTPVIFWGPFPIVSVDEASAEQNNYSSPDVLAHTWANSLRHAIRAFLASKVMPSQALYRNESGSDFMYKRTARTLDEPRALRNTRFVFSPDDLLYGVGVKKPGQRGFVVFVRRDDSANPPTAIFLGNPQATFTEYDLIPADETP